MNASPNREVALFSAALELPAEHRTAYLQEACADDPVLRQRLEALLRVHEEAAPFLETSGQARSPGVEVFSSIAPVSESPVEKAGDRIGRYKLLQQIGEGGCGVVYMAEQEQPVRRRVALKVIKLGMDTKQVVARFEAERQALALMDHPNIAKVLDAGATEMGRPYFVMELVRGIKITEYCDEHNLSTEERLKLFMQVCQAVQHAHQKGIIHRDIKPSNILVTIPEPGTPGCPKVIDFGIAKATTGQLLTDKTLFTAFEQFMGTPAYMSPEQAMMTALDIDTRTDIYSLGVLLYELLTGKTPLDQKELLAAGLEEMRRTIREKEPARPSTRLSTMLAHELTTAAKHRHTDAPKLVHLVRGDLDWIVMKCLEKERGRRYETANDLVMDLQKHLNCEPVVARPPSRLYEFQKTVRRHKFGFAAAAAVGAALVLGMVGSALEAARARRAERDQVRLRQQAQVSQSKSQTEAAKATAISDFLQEMLRSANPEALKGSDYTVRQMLDDFSAGLGNQFQDPEVEAALRSTVGRAYYRLGFADKAQVHQERALALRRRLFGNESEQVAESLVDYAWVCFEQAQYPKGEPYAREALEIYRKRGTVGRPVVAALWVMQKLAAQEGRTQDAEAIMTNAQAIAAKTPDLEVPEMASMLHGLAETKNAQFKFTEAEPLAQQAVAMHKRLRGSNDLEAAWALDALGVALRGQQKLPEAEVAFREALRIFRKQYSYGHKSVHQVMENLKSVLEAKGGSASLEALHREILASQRAALGSDSPAVAETLYSLAGALSAQGKQAEAEKAFREAIDILLKADDRARAELPVGVRRLAEAFKSQGNPQDAESLFETAITLAQQKLGETNAILGDLVNNYGDLLEHENKFEAAVQYKLKALQICRARPDNKLCFTLCDLGEALIQTGKPQQAEPHSREALGLYRKLHQQEDVDGTAWINLILGDALDHQHKLAEAELAYRDALLICKKCNALGHVNCARAVRSLLGVLKEQNKLAEGEAICRELLDQLRVASTNDNAALAQALSQLLGEALAELGRVEEGARAQREAIDAGTRRKATEPTNALYTKQEAFAVCMLAIMFEAAGSLDEAEAEYRHATALCEKANADFPNHPEFTEPLGRIKKQLTELVDWRRRLRLADSAYREVAEHGDAWELNECAWFLATCIDPSVRDGTSAVVFAEKAVAATSRTNAQILDTLASAYAELGDFAKALRIEQEVVALSQTEQDKRDFRAVIISFEHRVTRRGRPSLSWLPRALMSVGKLAEAEALLREDLGRMRAETTGTPSSESSELGLTLHHLADVLRQRKVLAEARSLAEEAVAMYRRHPDWSFNERQHAFSVLQNVLREFEDWTALELLLRQELSRLQPQAANSAPSDTSEAGMVLHHLADVLCQKKALGEARLRAEEALAMYQRHPDWPSNERQHALSVLEKVLTELEDFTALEPLVRQELDALRHRLAPDDPELAAAIAQLTTTLLAERKFTQAEPFASECLAIREKKLPDDWRTFNARSLLGAALLGQKRYGAETEAMLLTGYEGMKQREDNIPTNGRTGLKDAAQRLVELYTEMNCPNRAAEWKQKLDESEKPARNLGP